jgi:large subunit ribosomal protein L19
MSVHPLIQKIEAGELRSTALPSFSPGDTVRVNVRILDGEKERIQAYEGVVISIKGAANRRAFTVRKISQGFGVERVFPLHSPRISSLDVIRQGRVRRAKLYYLRDRRGKSARIVEDTNYKPMSE